MEGTERFAAQYRVTNRSMTGLLTRSFDEDDLEVSVKFVKQYNEYLKWWEQIEQMEESNDRQGP